MHFTKIFAAISILCCVNCIDLDQDELLEHFDHTKAAIDYLKKRKREPSQFDYTIEDIEETNRGETHHPHVQAPEELICFPHNTVNGVCTPSSGGTVIYSQDTIYDRQDLTAIILDDTTISCVRSDGFACSLTFQLQNASEPTEFSLTTTSSIEAKAIYFISQTTTLKIDATSYISVSGRSAAYSGYYANQGAAYLGQGGYCPLDGKVHKDKHYGEFDLMPIPSNIYDMRQGRLVGSMGEWNPLNVQTSGGGHIHLDIDAFQLTGSNNHIRANGLPEENTSEANVGNLNAGSGGYIYINTQNTWSENKYDSYRSRIEAKGGWGKNKGVGGAGGIVVFDKGVEEFDIGFVTYTQGGRGGSTPRTFNQTLCGNAAAGSTYWAAHDAVFLNNKGTKTDKFTYLTAKKRSPVKFPGSFLPAETMAVGADANAYIIGNNILKILFDAVYMGYYSSMKLDFRGLTDPTYNVTVYYNTDFQMASQYTRLDLTQTTGTVAFVDYEKTHSEREIVLLNDVTYSNSISIDVTSLQINGLINDPLESNTRQTSIKLFADQLFINQYAELQGDNIFLYSNNSIHLSDGSKLTSTVSNECETENGNEDLYQCIDQYDQYFNLQNQGLDAQYLVDNYNAQYNYNQSHSGFATNITDMTQNIMKKWNVYMLSANQINVEEAVISGPRIGLCSNNITIDSTTVSANGKGCAAQNGLGAGKSPQGCAGAGGAHGGKGGYGGSESSSVQTKATCLRNYPSSYKAGRDARLEGSGGGNGEQRNRQKDTGGPGGGIIWLTTPLNTTITNSSLEADGGAGQNLNYEQSGAGGGAGGSIQITTLNLRGDGFMTARGGQGSQGGGGGGGGGRVVMDYVKHYYATAQPDQSGSWKGDFNIDAGVAGYMVEKFQDGVDGQSGTFLSNPCQPGYSGVFCQACPSGTYKSDYSYGSCISCINKPLNAFYDNEAVSSSVCSYQCNSYLEKVEQNPDCLNEIELNIQRLGGQRNFFITVLWFLIYSLLIYFGLMYRHQASRDNIKNLREEMYYSWEDDAETNLSANTAEGDYELKDNLIFGHTHRMYLCGENSIKFPWFIPKDFPKDALSQQNRLTLLEFIDSYNANFQFTVAEKAFFFLVCIAFPGFGSVAHRYIRYSKFKRFQSELYKAFPPQFWDNDTLKGQPANKTFRLGCSMEDFRLAYIDFIDFKRTKDNWPGVQLPMAVLVSGSGTYSTPYFLDFADDVFIKSLALIKLDYFKEKLPYFFENFNSQLYKLSFYKMSAQVMRDLGGVVMQLEQANRFIFNHYGVKAVLYIVENQYKHIEVGMLKQKRRSFPLETIFFDACPDMYLSLLNYVKLKLLSGKSEIKLCLAFKRFTRKKQIQNQLRIKSMITSEQPSAFKVATENVESILFDENDNDKDESKVTIANGEVPELNQSSDERKTAKLVDKHKRAFSISIESSKAFELAIRKPRRKLHHHWTRLKGMFYSLYVLFLKHHGHPVQMKNVTPFYVIMALIVALDFMLVGVFLFHVTNPAVNWTRFGWAFFWVPPLLFAQQPIAVAAACVLGNAKLFKIAANMNSALVCLTYPLVMVLSLSTEDDPIFNFTLLALMATKIVFNTFSSKVVHTLINPRYQANQEKMSRFMINQARRTEKREQILGPAANRQLMGVSGLLKEKEGEQTALVAYTKADEARMRERLLSS